MIAEAIDTYLSVRRALGFKLRTDQTYLASYARFATKAGDTHMQTPTAIAWAKLAPSDASRAVRMNVLIRFARFARSSDHLHEVPPSDVFCCRRRRRQPYVFSDDEVLRIVQHARRLGPRDSIRPHTFSTLFGLLAATGLRISEALNLCYSDFTADGLRIRETKFRKSRLVCLHDSVTAMLDSYLAMRSMIASTDGHIFVAHRTGQRLDYAVVADTFHSVLHMAGIQGQPDGHRPRLHDYRHRFAVKALLTCPNVRERVDKHVLALSTYMGHAHVADTYWYLNSTPELMSDIVSACESYFQGDLS
jgi:integrase/recombinase XerD